MIRIDSIWLSIVTLDMRAGTDSALARVVSVFGSDPELYSRRLEELRETALVSLTVWR